MPLSELRRRPIQYRDDREYIQLTHGRRHPAQVINDAEEFLEGPVLGPFSAVTLTYLGIIRVSVANGLEVYEFGRYEDYVYYDGVYYGDVIIVSGNTAASCQLPEPVDFDPEKTKPPIRRSLKDAWEDHFRSTEQENEQLKELLLQAKQLLTKRASLSKEEQDWEMKLVEKGLL